jgi:hypothetical protein
MGHPSVQDKSNCKSKVNCPTQAKGRLVWATRAYTVQDQGNRP